MSDIIMKVKRSFFTTLPVMAAGILLFALGSIVKIIPGSFGEYIANLLKILYDYCNFFQGIGVIIIIFACVMFLFSVL